MRRDVVPTMHGPTPAQYGIDLALSIGTSQEAPMEAQHAAAAPARTPAQQRHMAALGVRRQQAAQRAGAAAADACAARPLPPAAPLARPCSPACAAVHATCSRVWHRNRGQWQHTQSVLRSVASSSSSSSVHAVRSFGRGCTTASTVALCCLGSPFTLHAKAHDDIVLLREQRHQRGAEDGRGSCLHRVCRRIRGGLQLVQCGSGGIAVTLHRT